MAVAFAPGNNSAKPELPSLRSLQSLCLRILSLRPPVEPVCSSCDCFPQPFRIEYATSDSKCRGGCCVVQTWIELHEKRLLSPAGSPVLRVGADSLFQCS